MRRLTFAGYLESYVRYLSGGERLTLSRLAAAVDAEPRLVEPLLLWAVKTGRAERLATLLELRSDLTRELTALRSLERRGRLETALASEHRELRREYAKVWKSYAVRAGAPARDADLKMVARERVLALEAAKGVTRYRMAKDLGLNHGNLHAFLAQGNVGKLSLDRAFKLVEYLQAA